MKERFHAMNEKEHKAIPRGTGRFKGGATSGVCVDNLVGKCLASIRLKGSYESGGQKEEQNFIKD